MSTSSPSPSRRRRRGAYLAVAVLGLPALAGCSSPGDSGGSDSSETKLDSDKVVFADYGGTTREARTAAFLDPFAEEYGVRAISADADPAKLPLFVENKQADWDLIDLDSWDVVRFSEQGALESLPDDVQRSDLVPSEYQEFATGGYNASTGIGYSTAEGSPVPTSWADFFDTTGFPGKRALPSFAYFEAEAALLADGVACEELYPLDFDRAFAKLDEIRGDILYYDSFGQAVQYLAQGSASMILIPNSRIQALKDQGLSVDFNWAEAFFTWTAAAVPKYAPDLDAALALVGEMSTPEAQAEFSKLTGYGPMTSEALDLLDEETLSQLPNAHIDEQCAPDPTGLAADMDTYSQEYQTWQTKK